MASSTSSRKFWSRLIARAILVAFVGLLFLTFFPLVDGVKEKKPTNWMPLSERVQKLNDLSLKRPLIRLNVEKFKNFIGLRGAGQPVRNYSFVVMMTALSPMRQCSVCRSAADEFQITANSYRWSPGYQANLFFGLVDYDEGSEIFQHLGLNSAPVFLYFPARSTRSNVFSIKHAEQMDIQRIGFAAETIARWVFEKTNVSIRVVRPPNYFLSFLVMTSLAVLCGLLYFRRNNFEFVFNKAIWSVLSMVLLFAMISGQMWSHIRSPPLMHRTNKGVSYIHGSSSGQFVIETYIVFALYAAVTGGFIMLMEAMRNPTPNPKQGNKNTPPEDKNKRVYKGYIGIAMIALGFSFLLSIFRSKAHGYPYSFLIK